MSEMSIFGSRDIFNSIGLVNVVLISTSSPFWSRIENETDRERFVIDGIWNLWLNDNGPMIDYEEKKLLV